MNTCSSFRPSHPCDPTRDRNHTSLPWMSRIGAHFVEIVKSDRSLGILVTLGVHCWTVDYPGHAIHDEMVGFLSTIPFLSSVVSHYC
jgi:hypothetical protein